MDEAPLGNMLMRPPLLCRARPGGRGGGGEGGRRCGRAGPHLPRPGPAPAPPRSRLASPGAGRRPRRAGHRGWNRAGAGRCLSASPEARLSAFTSPESGQPDSGRDFLMPVCKRLLFTFWLRIFGLRNCVVALFGFVLF